MTELVLDLKTGERGAAMRTKETRQLFGSTPLELRPHGDVMRQQGRFARSLRRARLGERAVKGVVAGAVALGVMEGAQAFAAGDPEGAIQAISVTGDVEAIAKGAGQAAETELRQYLRGLEVTGDQRSRLLELREDDRR